MTADYAADFVETLDTRPMREEAGVAAGLYACGPSAAVVEEVARGRLADVLGLPPHVSAGFVTGCQMAHVAALAARHHVLEGARLPRTSSALRAAAPVHA
jgi:hypothetical protein